MHITGISFLNSISWQIMFYTGSMIKNWKVKNIVDGITQVHKLYLQRGSNIKCMNADSKLESICRKNNALVIKLGYEYKKEHVPGIEHLIRTVTECVRSDRAAMTFKQVYKLVILHLVAYTIFWINLFTPSTPGSGLSDTKGTGQHFTLNCGLLKEILLPTARRTCKGVSIGWTPQHDWYLTDCWCDRPRTPI